MYGSEAVTEQVFRIQAFYILQIFREMTLRGVVAKHMSHDVPSILAAFDNPALELPERHGIHILVVGVCQYLPDIPAQRSISSEALSFERENLP